jgi:hypothetical protein
MRVGGGIYIDRPGQVKRETCIFTEKRLTAENFQVRLLSTSRAIGLRSAFNADQHKVTFHIQNHSHEKSGAKRHPLAKS